MSKIQYNNDDQVLGLDAFVGNSAVDRQMVFSIVIGLINFVKNFADAAMAIKWIRDVLRQSERIETADRFRPRVTWLFRMLIFATCLYLTVFAYTLMKLWGVVQCPYSMMNINGCATQGL